MRPITVALSVFAALMVAACGQFAGKPDRTPLVTLGDRTLYMDEVLVMIPDNLAPEDSTMMAESIVRNWVIQNLILEKAELNLSEEALNVDQRLEEYRRSLITYAYQEELVRQKLDTVVADTLITRYYNDNSANFELSENIIRALVIKWPKKDRDGDKVRKWMKSTDYGERQMLLDLCNQRALMMHLDDQAWLKVDELLKKLPEAAQIDAERLRTPRSIQVDLEDGTLYVEVLETKYGKSVAPIEFERDNIRHIILNKRKLELVKQMEKDIFDEAVAKKKFELIAPK